jgi:glycosyltransferase involved in cell wall biosynthesis
MSPISEHLATLLQCWKTQCPGKAQGPCWLRTGSHFIPGLDIFGFFRSEIGLGHSARLYYAAAEAQKISVTAVNRPLPGRESERALEEFLSPHGIHALGLSIEGLVGFRRLSRELCRQRRNIALPLWELDTLSGRRVKHLGRFDSLWAPSTFIKETLEAATQRSVALVRHPVHLADTTMPKSRPTGPLRVLFYFDFDSFPARKNPEGAVQAFQLAFSRNEDVLLTVKTRGVADAGRRSWLSHQASRDSRIRIIDETLSDEEIRNLLAQHDVFLSLHRSEGFGLGCAEALAIGNIVVSTDYGGTRDFISEKTGFPVACRQVPVLAGEYTDAEGACWAEPSIEHAAQRLREIYDAPGAALARAQHGRRHLERHHAIGVVGRRIRDLIVAEG